MKTIFLKPFTVATCGALALHGMIDFAVKFSDFSTQKFVTIWIGKIPPPLLCLMEIFLSAAVLSKMFAEKSISANKLYKTFCRILFPLIPAIAALDIFYIYLIEKFYIYMTMMPTISMIRIDEGYVLSERIFEVLLAAGVLLFSIHAFKPLKVKNKTVFIFTLVFFLAKYATSLFTIPNAPHIYTPGHFDPLTFVVGGLFLNAGLFWVIYSGFKKTEAKERDPSAL